MFVPSVANTAFDKRVDAPPLASHLQMKKKEGCSCDGTFSVTQGIMTELG